MNSQLHDDVQRISDIYHFSHSNNTRLQVHQHRTFDKIIINTALKIYNNRLYFMNIIKHSTVNSTPTNPTYLFISHTYTYNHSKH